MAYDIPEMAAACRAHGDCCEVELLDDWSRARSHRFDVVMLTLVLQHLENPETLTFYLTQLADMCDFIYVSTRSWVDGNRHPNVMRMIKETGVFEYVKGTVSEQEALAFEYPDESHFDVLMRTVNTNLHRRSNEELFDIQDMAYTANDLRLGITVAQLFTPNYDHWAFKVLKNKRAFWARCTNTCWRTERPPAPVTVTGAQGR